MEELFSRIIIDLFVLIICLRAIYIAVSRGILRESFRAAGLLTSSLIAFHYHSYLSGIISRKIPFLSKEYFLLFSFLLIFLGVGLISTLLRLIVTSFFKKREIYFKERLVLLVIGGFRALFLASIIIFLLHLSPLDSKRFCHSISYSISKNVGPKIYLLFLETYNKLDPEIRVNKEVEEYYETKKSLSRGNKKRR